MAKFTYSHNFNGYEIRVTVSCSYDKNLYIKEFDAHDMTLQIEKVFNELKQENFENGFISTAKHLIDNIPHVFTVEFVGKDCLSKYYSEEIKELFK